MLGESLIVCVMNIGTVDKIPASVTINTMTLIAGYSWAQVGTGGYRSGQEEGEMGKGQVNQPKLEYLELKGSDGQEGER